MSGQTIMSKHVILRKIRKAFLHPHDYIYDFKKKKEIEARNVEGINKELVILISQEMSYTGSPNSLLRMARIIKEKYRVIVFTLCDGPFRKEFEENDIPVIAITKEDIAKSYIRKTTLSAKFVIANTIGTSDFIRQYKKEVPIAWYIREAQNLTQYHKGRQNELKKFPFVCCVSEYAKEFIDRTFDVNSIVCHNAVEDCYHESICSGTMKVLFSGTVSERKGFDTLISAWEGLNEKFRTNSELIVAGRVIPQFKDFFNSIINPEKSDKLNIRYIGEIQDRQKYFELLNKIDFVVVPSRDESCSLVALEAAMMGKPLLVSENVGAKYLCKGESETIFKTGDIEDLRRKIEKFISLGHKGLKEKGVFFRKNYLEDSTFEKYRDRFDVLLNKINAYSAEFKGKAEVKKKKSNEINRKQDQKLYKFISYDQLSKIIQTNINRFRKYDLIVGIPRSGMIPAYMIAFYLNKRVCSLNEFISGQFNKTFGYRKINTNQIKNILILDDSMLSGRAIKDAKQEIESINELKKYSIEYGCIFGTSKNSRDIDLCITELDPSRIFQWNYLNHPNCKNWCFDIDGVLCEDPSNDQNDDGPIYSDFVLNAPPLFVPKYEIGALVTSRLEKYRSLTEEWARKNNIHYKYLAMLDLPDKKTRLKQKAHTRTKIEFYGSHPEFNLFVESNPKQAEEIARATGKQVICVETAQLFHFPKTINTRVEEIFMSKKYCNVCNSNFDEFKEFGPSKRKALCPNCKSLERTRFLWFNLVHELPYLREKILYLNVSNTLLQGLLKSNNSVIKKFSDCDEISEKFDFLVCENFITEENELIRYINKIQNFMNDKGKSYVLIPDSLIRKAEMLTLTNVQFKLVKHSDYPREINTKFNIKGNLCVFCKQ